MKKGKLIVISGPSGVGKGTVIKALLASCDRLRLSVSATTRAMRPGEVDGVNYHFVTKERFEQMIAQNELLEYARYVENYYGTPEFAVDRMLEAGLDVVLEIEVQGALQVKKRRPDAVLIFIAAPSYAELSHRLLGRGDTPEAQIAQRLETARFEYSIAPQYDYIVVNDLVEEARDEILTILAAEALRAQYQLDVLKGDE